MDKQIKQIVESIIFLRNIWKSWNNSEGENNDYYSIFFHDEGIYHIETRFAEPVNGLVSIL